MADAVSAACFMDRKMRSMDSNVGAPSLTVDVIAVTIDDARVALEGWFIIPKIEFS